MDSHNNYFPVATAFLCIGSNSAGMIAITVKLIDHPKAT